MSARHRQITQVEPERLAKLPVYAQDEINRSRRVIIELVAELEALIDPNQAVSTHADPHGDRPKPIGDYPTVRHRLASGDQITMELLPHKVSISANGSSYHHRPVVVPRVSNALDIVMIDERHMPSDPRPEPDDPWKVRR